MSSNDDRLDGRSAPATSPAATALSVGDAIRYGWERFKANPWTWIGAVVIAAVIQSVLNGLFGNRSTFRVDTFGQSFWTVSWIVGSIVTTVVGYLINAAFVRVQQLLSPPSVLFTPAMVARVLWHSRRVRPR